MTSEQPANRVQRIERILLPLDGSAFAETAIPVAVRLALALSAEVIVARIIPTMVWTYAAAGGPMSADAYDRLMRDEEREAGRYLLDVAEKARAKGVTVRTIAARGDIASALLDISAEEHADLVVMSSHGRTGVSRFALGSVADRMLRASDTPVWIVRPAQGGAEAAQEPFERAIVALDGSERAESAFDFTAALAGKVFTSVTLLRISSGADSDAELAELKEYLSQAATRLRSLVRDAGVEISTELAYGGVAEEILASGEDGRAVIVVATHGETGARRWAFGSVADRVLHGARTPVLVTRIPHE